MAKYNGSGWHKESVRHSRAKRLGRAGGQYATQIKKSFVAKKTIPSNVSIDENNFGFETAGAGKLKLRLGNWTTTGWHWDGNEKDFFGYLARINSSQVKNDFLKKMNEQGLTLEQFKTIINNSIKTKNGLYELSGDNALWNFGGYEPDYDSIQDGILQDLNDELPQKLSKEQEEKFFEELDKKVDLSKTREYDDFEKEKIKEFQKEALEKINKAKDWEELMSDLEDMHEGWYEEAITWQDDNNYDAYYRAYNEVLKDKEIINKIPVLQDIASRQKLREASQNPEQTTIMRYTKNKRK